MKKTFITGGILLALVFGMSYVPVKAQGQTLLDQLTSIFTVTDSELQIASTVDAPAFTIGDHTITTTDDGSLCIGACEITDTTPEPLTWPGAVTDIQSGLDAYYTANTAYPSTLEYYPQNDADSVFEGFLDNLTLDNSNADIIATIPDSVGTMIIYGYQNATSELRCPDQGVNSYAMTLDANDAITGMDTFEYNTAGAWHFYCVTGSDNV
jgi:hypothetical protein